MNLSDPDGDIVRIEFEWYQGDSRQVTSVINSPADRNLSGFTSGTQTFTFTLGPVSSSLNRVDVQATDLRGNRSNKFSKTF